MRTHIITRKEYWENSSELHEAYYEQFVTHEIETLVSNYFGISALDNAFNKDKNFNTLPLSEFDYLTCRLPSYIRPELELVGDFYSLAGGVCILKSAARLAVENFHETYDKMVADQ